MPAAAGPRPPHIIAGRSGLDNKGYRRQAVLPESGRSPRVWDLKAADGLPVGVHFAGRYGEEATLLALVAELEAAQPWFDRVPEP